LLFERLNADRSGDLLREDKPLLKSLTYSATFPSTGRTLSGQFDFRKGFGTMTGPNEASKSFVIEMVRYCLFGSAALRSKAEDYKKLVASLTFAMKGKTYTINRKSTGATLLRGAEQITTGTRPVNEKLIETLGFGLEVFDIACVANQGDLEKVGAMKPAERKRMVDSSIGLGDGDFRTTFSNFPGSSPEASLDRADISGVPWHGQKNPRGGRQRPFAVR
jgi:hypothetical protein